MLRLSSLSEVRERMHGQPGHYAEQRRLVEAHERAKRMPLIRARIEQYYREHPEELKYEREDVYASKGEASRIARIKHEVRKKAVARAMQRRAKLAEVGDTLSVNEVAYIFKRSPCWVHQRCQRGMFRAVKVLRAWRIFRESVNVMKERMV